MILILYFSLFCTALEIDPPGVFLPFFNTKTIPTSKEMDDLSVVLENEEEGRLAGLTSNRLLANLKEYREMQNHQILHQIRKLVHDYATESRSIVEKFIDKKKLLPNSMPIIALYHVRRIITEMPYLTKKEKNEIIDSIDYCTLPIDKEEEEKIQKIKENTSKAFIIALEVKLFFSGRIEEKKIKSVIYRLVDLVEEKFTWSTRKKLKTLELLQEYDETTNNNLLRDIAGLFQK